MHNLVKSLKTKTNLVVHMVLAYKTYVKPLLANVKSPDWNLYKIAVKESAAWV